MSSMASLAGQQELGQLQQGRELMGFWGSNLLKRAGAMDLKGVSLFQVLSHPEKLPKCPIHGAGSDTYSALQALRVLLFRRDELRG